MKSHRAKRAELADQLHSAAIHLLRQLRKEDDASGLSAPRLSALSVVVFAGPVTLGQLARAEQVKPPTMTKIVTGLEKDGLVERKADSHDGRLTRIVATARGQRILLEGRARRVRSLTQAVEGLSETELAQLERGIKVFQKLISATRRQPSEENAET
ncbi:MAG TPA: MarR family transcriptional regulator [Gemmatimonadaceae bacterium]